MLALLSFVLAASPSSCTPDAFIWRTPLVLSEPEAYAYTKSDEGDEFCAVDPFDTCLEQADYIKEAMGTWKLVLSRCRLLPVLSVFRALFPVACSVKTCLEGLKRKHDDDYLLLGLALK